MRRSILVAAALLVALLWGIGPAEADLTLTAAGTADGFTISTFASGFPTVDCGGPLGIAFPNTGGVLVTDYPGNVRLFATDTDGQTAAAGVVGQNYGFHNAVGLGQIGANIYMTRQGQGDVLQVNSNGTLNQFIVGIPFAIGIIGDPANGQLFVSNVSQVFDVDPVAKTETLFVHQAADGLSISLDNKTLYMALPGAAISWATILLRKHRSSTLASSWRN